LLLKQIRKTYKDSLFNAIEQKNINNINKYKELVCDISIDEYFGRVLETNDQNIISIFMDDERLPFHRFGFSTNNFEESLNKLNDENKLFFCKQIYDKYKDIESEILNLYDIYEDDDINNYSLTMSINDYDKDYFRYLSHTLWFRALYLSKLIKNIIFNHNRNIFNGYFSYMIRSKDIFMLSEFIVLDTSQIDSVYTDELGVNDELGNTILLKALELVEVFDNENIIYMQKIIKNLPDEVINKTINNNTPITVAINTLDSMATVENINNKIELLNSLINAGADLILDNNVLNKMNNYISEDNESRNAIRQIIETTTKTQVKTLAMSLDANNTNKLTDVLQNSEYINLLDKYEDNKMLYELIPDSDTIKDYKINLAKETTIEALSNENEANDVINVIDYLDSLNNELLINGFIENNEKSILMLAIENENIDVIDYLLNKEAIVNNLSYTYEGNTAMDVAVASNNNVLINKLQAFYQE
jgi:hypothetical protein